MYLVNSLAAMVCMDCSYCIPIQPSKFTLRTYDFFSCRCDFKKMVGLSTAGWEGEVVASNIPGAVNADDVVVPGSEGDEVNVGNESTESKEYHDQKVKISLSLYIYIHSI